MRVLLMVCFCLGVMSASAARAGAPGPVAPAAPTITWRVEDRFRLLAGADLDPLMDRLATSSLEEAYPQIITTLTGANWDKAKTALKANFQPARAVGDPFGGYRPAYLKPAFLTLTMRVENVTGQCDWLQDGATARDDQGRSLTDVDCAAAQRLKINAAGKGLFRSAITARVRASGQVITPETPTTAIRDELIVGLGDSFASGEGNPDRPSSTVAPEPPPSLDAPLTRHAQTVEWYEKLEAAHVAANDAEWFDRPCHRSLLSYQVLAALAYSAHRPHQAVTLVALACSGASVFDGVVSPQIGLPGADEKSRDLAQLAQLQNLLCGHALTDTGTMVTVKATGWRARRNRFADDAPVEIARCNDPVRPVDKVLLSVGGNDIGFAGIISWAVVPERGYHFFGDFAMTYANDKAGVVCPYEPDPPVARCREENAASKHIKEMPAVYTQLREALGGLGMGETPVYQTTYPNPLYAGPPDAFLGGQLRCPMYRKYHHYVQKDGKPDRPDRDYLFYRDGDWIVVTPGLDAAMTAVPNKLPVVNLFNKHGLQDRFQMWLLADREAPEVQSYVIGPLNAAVARNRRPGRWEIVDGFESKVIPHGWCAVDGVTVGKDLPALAEMQQRQLTYPVGADGVFQPYDRRQRWFRTLNDSMLTERRAGVGKADAGDMIEGGMHPTAELHAVMADAVLAKIDETSPPAH